MYVLFYLRHHIAVELWILAFLTLLHIIPVQGETLLAEQEHCHHVGDDHKRHGKVYNAESFLQRHVSAQQDRDAGEEAEDEDGLAVLADEADVGLAIEIVGNDGTVGKQEDGGGEEPTSAASHEMLQCASGQNDTVFAVGIKTAEDDDKGGAGTDQQGVRKYTQRL